MAKVYSRHRAVVWGFAALGCVLLTSVGAEAQQNTPTASVPPQIVGPTPSYSPSAVYPAQGQGAGFVILEIQIGVTGSVERVKAREGADIFVAAAAAAVRRWRFSPATSQGVAVPARILVKIEFPAPLPAAAASSVPNGPEGSSNEISTEVTVQGARTEIGITLIPLEDARRVPGTFGDPLRAAVVLPAVTPYLSALPYYYVRGAPPSNVGYEIDGVRVPFLFHVGPGPSVISPALIDSVDLYASAFPARLGRYAGGIMSGSMREPSGYSRGEVQFRIFDGTALIEQTAGKASVLVAGRVSYMEPILALVAPDFEIDYWDYQARLAYELSSRSRLSILTFGASDLLYDVTEDLTVFDSNFGRAVLQYAYRGISGKTTVSLGLGRDRIQASANPRYNRTGGNSLKTKGGDVRVYTTQQLTESVEIRAGLDYRADEVVGEFIEYPDGSSLTVPDRTDISTGTHLDFVLRPFDSLEVVPGIRFETGLWRDAGYLYPEPRVAFRLRLLSGVAWTSAMGVVHQLPTVAVRPPGLIPGPLEQSVQEAWQIAEGLEFSLPLDMTGHVKGFNSYVKARKSRLSARYYGVEFFVQRDFSHRIGFYLSYTLSSSLETNDFGTFALEFDRPHVLSATFGMDLGAGFRLGLRGYAASGKRYRIQCADRECGPALAGTLTPVVEKGRLSAFARLDTRIEKRWSFDSGSWVTLAAEIFNVTQSDEDFGVTWSPENGREEIVQDALTLPSLNLEAGF